MRLRLAVCLVVVSAGGVVADDHGARGGSRHVQWPSRDGISLQAAIDAAPDGATVEIAAGVYRLGDPLYVRGKRLTIVGAGATRTRFVGPPPQPVVDVRGAIVLPPDAVIGLWNFVDADVTIDGLALEGFDAGIVTRSAAATGSGSSSTDGGTGATTGVTAPPVVRGRPTATTVRDVTITNTGRGVLGLASGSLELEHGTISNTRWNAVSLAPLRDGRVHVQDFQMIDPAGAGIYFEHASPVIENTSVTGASHGGIVGVASVSFISETAIIDCAEDGILLQGGWSDIHDNEIWGTTSVLVDNQQLYGDGASFLESPGHPMTATLHDNVINYSDRAGVSSFGANVTLGDNEISCSALDLDGELEDGVDYLFIDEGSNACGCGDQEACKEDSSTLSPPPMVAGLE